MKIGIDLDNTITASKDSVEFFRVITHLLIPEHDIVILTNRDESDGRIQNRSWMCWEFGTISWF